MHHLNAFARDICSHFWCYDFRCPVGHYPLETTALIASFRESSPLTLIVYKSHSEEIRIRFTRNLAIKWHVSGCHVPVCSFPVIINWLPKLSPMSYDSLYLRGIFLFVGISPRSGCCLLSGFTTVRSLL